MENGTSESAPPIGARISAWSVHLFTATGALLGVLAITELYHDHEVAFFWCLIAATAIDSCDGYLARRFRVKHVLPRFDGALLDNMVDYFLGVSVLPKRSENQRSLFPGLAVVLEYRSVVPVLPRPGARDQFGDSYRIRDHGLCSHQISLSFPHHEIPRAHPVPHDTVGDCNPGHAAATPGTQRATGVGIVGIRGLLHGDEFL